MTRYSTFLLPRGNIIVTKVSIITLFLLLTAIATMAQAPPSLQSSPPTLASRVPAHNAEALKTVRQEDAPLLEGSLRVVLSRLFTEANVPFMIGPEVEGNVSLGKLPLTREETICLVLLASPQRLKWSVEEKGVRVISLATLPTPSAHQSNTKSFPTAYEAVQYDLQTRLLSMKNQKQGLLDSGFLATSPDVKTINKLITRTQNNLRVHQIDKDISDIKAQIQNIENSKTNSELGTGNPIILTMNKLENDLKSRINILEKEKSILETGKKIAEK
jgi:hypothetical protein